MTQDAHQTLIGSTLAGRYVIRELVGTGSFGSVYRAEHVALGTRVAVKMLHVDLASPQVRARFELEARTAAQLRHPNSVSIMDFGDEGGQPFIVMEFLDGYTLADVVAESPTLSLERIVAIMAQVCAGLAAAHAVGVTHRDIKPENVVLVEVPGSKGKREHAKLCDFGIARTEIATGRTDGRPLTMAGQVVGTPAFMSPEQALGDPVDPRTDIYACGIVLYLLATGTIPFDHASPMAVLQAHVDHAPTPPSVHVPDMPPAYEAIVLRCIAKHPDDRFPSAESLRRSLLELLEDPAIRNWSFEAEIRSGTLPTLSRPVTQPDDFGEVFDTGRIEKVAPPDAENIFEDVGLTTLEQELDEDPFYDIGLSTEERMGIDFDNELELDDDAEDVDELRAALRSVARTRTVATPESSRRSSRRRRTGKRGSGGGGADSDAVAPDPFDRAPDPFGQARGGAGRLSSFYIDATRNRVPSADQAVVSDTKADTPPERATSRRRWLMIGAAALLTIGLTIAVVVALV